MDHPTQFKRALARLGVHLEPACSPEARGRSERAFGTLQERLVKEMAQAGIIDMESANDWLKAVYPPRHNRWLARKPRIEGKDAFVPLVDPGLLERRTGLLFAAPLRNKKASTAASAIIRLLRPVKDYVHTITFDNGREFARHRRVACALRCDSYYARPYRSCDKGGVENANGLLRECFPKSMRLDQVRRKDVDAAVDDLNQRPKKRLGWNAPDEAFQQEIHGPPQGELWYKAA